MKVTLRLIKDSTAQRCYLKKEVHTAIGLVLWEDDWVRLIPTDSGIQQISYRKDLVVAVVEEKEDQ